MGRYSWEPVPIENIRSLIDYVVLFVCEQGTYRGDLLAIDERGIFIETGEGQVIEIDAKALEEPHVQVYKLKIH